MKITLAATSIKHAIQSHETGQIIINQEPYTKSLVVTPDQLIPDWKPQSLEALTEADFAELIALKPNIVILGTGGKQIFPSPALYGSLLEQGIGIEIMNTPAACRTYNLLMAEGRAVAAALFMILE